MVGALEFYIWMRIILFIVWKFSKYMVFLWYLAFHNAWYSLVICFFLLLLLKSYLGLIVFYTLLYYFPFSSTNVQTSCNLFWFYLTFFFVNFLQILYMTFFYSFEKLFHVSLITCPFFFVYKIFSILSLDIELIWDLLLYFFSWKNLDVELSLFAKDFGSLIM